MFRGSLSLKYQVMETNSKGCSPAQFVCFPGVGPRLERERWTRRTLRLTHGMFCATLHRLAAEEQGLGQQGAEEAASY